MGGSGSGRWRGHSAKQTVEDGLSLSTSVIRRTLSDVAERNLLSSHSTITWSRGSTVTSRVTCRITPSTRGPLVNLSYTITRWNNEKTDLDYKLEVVATAPNFGGRRWWWICPLVKNGLPCNRRVGKLYLPPGALYFGCRQCYDLTYTSCQESHKLDSIWERIADSVNRKRGLLAGQGFTPADVGRLLKRARETKPRNKK